MGAERGGSETFKASVEAANERGLKVAGSWLNWSKFVPEGERTAAAKGDIVTVTVDKDGFLRKLEHAGGGAAANGPGVVGAVPVGGTGRSATQDRRIVREVALKAAVDFLGAKMRAIALAGGTGGPTSEAVAGFRAEHVTALAEKLAAWITAGEEGAGDE